MRRSVGTRRSTESGWFAIGLASAVLFGAACGFVGGKLAAQRDRDWPEFTCEEDEAMLWVDARHTAACIPLDLVRDITE